MNDISDVFLAVSINKANPGEMDADGNYIFEVEASNENLDLQNQIVQQKALVKSKDYFLTNGVISDDHLHKTRDENGNVETHKDKIIGEPLEIWTEGSRTFVKGKLYGNNKYAKEYINLLKANSSRVHASVGGIMPKTRKNPDGSETVTSFMWNDLALTCSPVNWTVGSAKFAKSLSNVDFCKALTAGSGTDSASLIDGEALKKESLEGKTTDILEAETIEKKKKDDEDDIDSVIAETVEEINKGNLNSETEVCSYLMERGFSEITAETTAKEIMEEGESQMMKSGFFSSISDRFEKSFGKKTETCKKSEDKKEKDEETKDESKEDDVDDDEFDFDEDISEDDDVEKSFEDNDYVNADAVLKEMNDNITNSKNEIESLKKSLAEKDEEIEELKKSIEMCADMIQTIGNTPQLKKSVMTAVSKPDYASYEAPTQEDFEMFKDVLCRAKKDNFAGVDLRKSVHLESAFQKAVNGVRMSDEDESLVRKIYSKYNGGEE